VKYKVKSQIGTDAESLKGILDDCGPSSMAAAVAWASGYLLDPTATEGVKAKEKATGRKEKQGVSDNGSSLSDLIKTAKVLGANARYAESWEDVIQEARKGAAIGIWVQQPAGYPKDLEVSEWHDKWKRWWWVKQKQPDRTYGHMTSAGWDPVEGWQWSCPTRSGKGKEAFGVKVTEDQLKKIADSKRVSGKSKAPAHKHCIIIWLSEAQKEQLRTAKAQKEALPPGAKIGDIDVALDDFMGKVGTPEERVIKKPAEAPQKPVEAPKVETRVETPPAKEKAPEAVFPSVTLPDMSKIDWMGKAEEAASALAGALEASKKGVTKVDKVKIALLWIKDNTGVDEALFEALRAFLATSIAVSLGLGIPLLDLSGGDFRTILSAGLAACLQVVVRALNPEDSKFGIGKK
jgi:hypothetical protein